MSAASLTVAGVLGGIHQEGAAVVNHEVKFVSDNELSDSQPWALVVHKGAVILLIRESAVTPATLNEAWAAFCGLVQERPALAALAA